MPSVKLHTAIIVDQGIETAILKVFKGKKKLLTHFTLDLNLTSSRQEVSGIGLSGE